MTSTTTDLVATRLRLAATRQFAEPGAGEARRAALASDTATRLSTLWAEVVGPGASGLALAAVGSQGRRDAGPLSDLDLILVYQRRAATAEQVAETAERLWYPLWDSGIRLDHSVRTVQECRSVAESDLAAAIGLLDLALVAGDDEVVAAARATAAHDWRATARRRLPELLEQQRVRHLRHGDLGQSVEPELKEARGGLRDMLLLRALTSAWLADRRHGPVDAAYSRLLDVRDALHVVTGRGRDRLVREEQDAVAALLGLASADDLLTEVSQAGRVISHALEGTARRAGQSQRARVLRTGPRRPRLRPLGYGLFEHDGEVVLGGSRPSTDPLLALRAAVVAARCGLPIAPATLTTLAEIEPMPLPWPPEAVALLGDLLAAGPGLIQVWEGLDQAGVVAQWLPEWAAVRSRPQRSPVHRHTVDRHLIETVVIAGSLVRRVARADLLLLAALLHDIGKVAGARDHSAEGAQIAHRILVRLGLAPRDREVVVRLVREHLTLIELATRRDVADPATLEAAMAAADHDPEVFEMLAALTEADASAAGPLAWTDWRARLLGGLVAAVEARLTARRLPGAGSADPEEPEEREDPESRAAVALPGESSSERAAILARAQEGTPTVRLHIEGPVAHLDIVDRDRVGLFADTAGLLAAYGLVVRAAMISTVEGAAVDRWTVESPSGDLPSTEELVRALRRLGAGDRAPLAALDRRAGAAPRALLGGAGQARAFVVPDASADALVVEVRAQDRPGLLRDLGQAVAGLGLAVRSAHISTHAGQTLDTLYLTRSTGGAVDPALAAQAVAAIIDTCGAR
ncbi:MAG: [protein-PII] uridylyltransferase [Micrococcales bacterium]|nr:[protein-PII] uridylyltransferase [Micrococcales bacterium]